MKCRHCNRDYSPSELEARQKLKLERLNKNRFKSRETVNEIE